MSFSRLAVAASMAASVLLGQGQVEWPSMGFVTDSVARSVRDIEGVPAAALMSEPLTAAQSMAWITAAPARSYALGVDAESGAVQLVTAVSRLALEGMEPGARGVQFSPGGSAAALLYADYAVVIPGLPDHRAESWRVPLPAGAKIAVSDDGRAALVRHEERLTLVSAEGSSSEVAGGEWGRAQFTENSQDVLIAARSAVIEADTRRWELPEGSASVIAAAGSAGRVLALLEGGEIAVWDRAASQLQRIHCDCQANQLTRVGRAGLYRLNDAGDGPVWLLDAVGEARILFVPGAARSAE